MRLVPLFTLKTASSAYSLVNKLLFLYIFDPSGCSFSPSIYTNIEINFESVHLSYTLTLSTIWNDSVEPVHVILRNNRSSVRLPLFRLHIRMPKQVKNRIDVKNKMQNEKSPFDRSVDRWVRSNLVEKILYVRQHTQTVPLFRSSLYSELENKTVL